MALVLSDFDSSGLEVETLALLSAVEDGDPSPSVLYADSNRGGTSVPVDGELGVGSDEVLVTRVRRSNDDTLQVNDNNVPAVLSFPSYFGSGGEAYETALRLSVLQPMLRRAIAALDTARGEYEATRDLLFAIRDDPAVAAAAAQAAGVHELRLKAWHLARFKKVMRRFLGVKVDVSVQSRTMGSVV